MRFAKLVSVSVVLLVSLVSTMRQSLAENRFELPPPPKTYYMPLITNPDRSGQIGDRVWADTKWPNSLSHGYGIQDPNEVGMFSITVTLYFSSGAFISSQRTSISGTYLFTNLTAGHYIVEFSLPYPGYVPPSTECWTYSPQFVGNDRALDSDPDPVTRRTKVIALSPGHMIDRTVDAGFSSCPLLR